MTDQPENPMMTEYQAKQFARKQYVYAVSILVVAQLNELDEQKTWRAVKDEWSVNIENDTGESFDMSFIDGAKKEARVSVAPDYTNVRHYRNKETPKQTFALDRGANPIVKAIVGMLPSYRGDRDQTRIECVKEDAEKDALEAWRNDVARYVGKTWDEYKRSIYLIAPNAPALPRLETATINPFRRTIGADRVNLMTITFEDLSEELGKQMLDVLLAVFNAYHATDVALGQVDIAERQEQERQARIAEIRKQRGLK